MVELVESDGGIVLHVRAQPRASRNAIRGEQNGMLKVSVTQVAERGKANDAIVETLAKGLGLKRSQIELVSGATQREKRLLVRGVKRNELSRLIAQAIADNC